MGTVIPFPARSAVQPAAGQAFIPVLPAAQASSGGAASVLVPIALVGGFVALIAFKEYFSYQGHQERVRQGRRYR